MGWIRTKEDARKRLAELKRELADFRRYQLEEEEWQRRGFGARECDREGDAERNDSPIRRIVQPRSPDRAAINLSPIEMRKRANGCRVDLVWAPNLSDCFHALMQHRI